MQQTLTSITEQSILELESKGWRFRASARDGRNRLITKRGQVEDAETIKLLRQVKVSEACDYLTERAKYFIRQCKAEMGGGK
jgi:hypothetical protein